MKWILGLIAACAFTVTAWSQPAATNSQGDGVAAHPAGKEWFFGNTKHPWWSNETSMWIGGTGGSFFGCLGALVGVLGGMGKCRRFVIGLLKAQAALGVVFLVAGIVAFFQHQAYGVWYPLLLGGVLLTAICSALVPGMAKAYRDRELRRMQSLDAAG